jgi:hypothetical protein
MTVAFLAGPASPGLSAEPTVDIKNDASLSISVPLGSDNGVGRDNDFQVSGDNVSVTIYPQEIYDNRFWSQPLPGGAYARIKTGMAVRPVTLDRAGHLRVRAEGDARRAEVRARQEDARRQVHRKKIEDLMEKREILVNRRDVIEERIASAEKDLADEEGRMDWLMSSEDDRIDRSLQAIQDLADRRDELQSQREALSRSTSRNDANRQSAEIKRLNDRISSERDNIRLARDRKRSTRTTYMSRKQEWQKLVAERNALQNEIRSIDQKVKALSERN